MYSTTGHLALGQGQNNAAWNGFNESCNEQEPLHQTGAGTGEDEMADQSADTLPVQSLGSAYVLAMNRRPPPALAMPRLRLGGTVPYCAGLILSNQLLFALVTGLFSDCCLS